MKLTVATLASVLMISAAEAGELKNLAGSWAEEACNVETWEIMHMSGSKYQIAVNEWGCDLQKYSRKGSTLVFRTTCYGETDSYRSTVTIEKLGGGKIRFKDGATGSSAVLRRC